MNEGPVLGPAEGETFFLEELEIEDDGDLDTTIYTEVPEDVSDDSDYELQKTIAAATLGRQTEAKLTEEAAPVPVIDDFFRNFLLLNGFHDTLKTFQTEYYEKIEKGLSYHADLGAIPDVYRENQCLSRQLEQLRRDLQKSKDQAHQVKSTWDQLRKARDFHRLHHRRVVQEKNKLITDMKRLRKFYSSFEPTIKLLKEKYENTMKEKMIMKIERDRLAARTEALLQQLKTHDEGSPNQRPAIGGDGPKKPSPSSRHKTDTPYPADRSISLPNGSRDPINIDRFVLQKTFKGHTMAISDVAFHPRKEIIATVSDDRTWKLWSIPSGDLIMSGEGHRDWIASCAIHPQGNLLATASGDGTIKIWDFVDAACKSTFSDHSQVVWSCAFHSLGDFLVSCSIDHSAKLWDLKSERCRHTFRGHVDSVNYVVFQPSSNCFATASGDKTISLWDLRSGLCVQTFFGHSNAVNHLAFNAPGDQIASCDADGVVKLWDIRTVNQILDIPSSTGKSANRMSFERSGSLIMSAGDDCLIRVRNAKTGEELSALKGHDDSVQSMAMNPAGTIMVSAGSDSTFRLWGL